MSGSKQRNVDLFGATSIVVANMIGTGVFTSLGYQLFDIQSGFGIVMIWLVGGLLALCGAFCYAELATRLPEDGGDRRLLGTSGTVTTLASVYLKLNSYDRRAVDGLHLPTAAMRDISRELARRNIEGRAEFPTIGHERADLVVAGCAILEAIFDIWPGERLGVADRGIREGILRALMASDAKRRNRRN